MKSKLIMEIEKNANYLFTASLKYLREKDLYGHYKLLAIAKEFYHYLEDTEKLELCNRYFENGIEKRWINQSYVDEIQSYGKTKAKFILGLQIEGKKYLENLTKNSDGGVIFFE